MFCQKSVTEKCLAQHITRSKRRWNSAEVIDSHIDHSWRLTTSAEMTLLTIYFEIIQVKQIFQTRPFELPVLFPCCLHFKARVVLIHSTWQTTVTKQSANLCCPVFKYDISRSLLLTTYTVLLTYYYYVLLHADCGWSVPLSLSSLLLRTDCNVPRRSCAILTWCRQMSMTQLLTW